MALGGKNIKRLFGFTWFSYEAILLLVFALVVAGYIFILKTSKNVTVFVGASIEKPDWWQTTSSIPTQLLTSIKVGDTDVQGDLKIVELKYFISQEASWEVNVNDRDIGRIEFQIKANKQNGKYYYEGQELFVGNPLVVEVGNTRLELLINQISDKKIDNNYIKKNITVRIYNKYWEQVAGIKTDMELKDNDGITYAKVNSITTEHSRITTTDQAGRTHSERDPWKYDLVVEMETLVRQVNSRYEGYDGRAIAIGKSFIFNSPDMDDVGGYIMSIY